LTGFSVSDDVTKLLLSDIGNILAELDRGHDIRYALAMLPELASKMKSMGDLNETPENRWISYILVDQLGNVQNWYDGMPPEWYKLNEKNVAELRKIWKSYFEKLSVELSRKDFDRLADETKNFFFELWRLQRSRTMRERR